MRMTKRDYRIRSHEERLRILQELNLGEGDKDVLNLEFIMYGILPGSSQYNMGCISSLRKAIKLLEKEKAKEKANNEK